MAYGNTNVKTPISGGVHSINTPKGVLPKWIDDIANTAGDIIDVGKDIIEYVNEEDQSQLDKYDEQGGAKGSEGNQWDWWNPFSWAKWPWEGEESTEGGSRGQTTKWVVLAVAMVAASYIFLRVFKGANNNKW